MTKRSQSTKSKSIGYLRGGKETTELDSDECLAKMVVGPEGGPTYMARFFADGITAGSLYDFNSPMRSYGADRARKRGEDLYPFRKVTKRCFEFYLRYLKTENRAHLNTAHREVN